MTNKTLSWTFAGIVVLAVAGCGGGGSAPPPPTPPPPTTPPPQPPPPPPPTALTNPIPEEIGFGDITVMATEFVRTPQTQDLASPGGTNNPYARIQYIQEAPGIPGRFFINDTRGILWVYEESWDVPVELLNLADEAVGFYPNAFPNESGLQGFALHPQYAEENTPGYGKFYTSFSSDPASGTADFIESAGSVQESSIMEWTMEDAKATTFSGSRRELFRVGQFAPNHNVGSIAFNPTAAPGSADYGNLYVTFGDGGAAHDPAAHGQNPNSILGTVVRIDPLGGVEGESEYGIPADNPFADGTNGLPEVWAYGLRHPQHLSWDSSDGRMFLIDIGQDQIEEINIGVAGGNYGWRVREGTFATVYGVSTSDQAGGVYERGEDSETYQYPVAQYDHDEGFAVSSGFVYRGTAIPALVGMYVFADIVRGRVFYFDASTASPGNPATLSELRIEVEGTEQSLLDVAGFANPNPGHAPHNRRVDLRLSADSSGELFLLSKGDGWVRRLTAP